MHLLNKQLETSDMSEDDSTHNNRNIKGMIVLFKIERNNSQSKQRDNSKKKKEVGKSNSKKRKINETLKNAKNLYIKSPLTNDYQSKRFECYSTTNNNNPKNFLLD